MEELYDAATIWKDEKKVNVLYIVDQNHQRYVILVDNFRNFKNNGGYNGEIFIQERKLLFEIEKTES